MAPALPAARRGMHAPCRIARRPVVKDGLRPATPARQAVSRQLCRKDSAAAAAAQSQNAAGYVGSDGRRKATFEEAFRANQPGDDQQLPWRMSWQRNEQSLTFADDTRAHMVKVRRDTRLQAPLRPSHLYRQQHRGSARVSCPTCSPDHLVTLLLELAVFAVV